MQLTRKIKGARYPEKLGYQGKPLFTFPLENMAFYLVS